MSLFTKQKQSTDLEKELMVYEGWEKDEGKG